MRVHVTGLFAALLIPLFALAPSAALAQINNGYRDAQGTWHNADGSEPGRHQRPALRHGDRDHDRDHDNDR
jgi:hypothetical protein